MKHIVTLITLIVFVFATSCRAKLDLDSDRTTEPPPAGAVEQAAKLTSDDCVDPDLSLVSSSTSLMLCDGTMAEGTFEAPKTCAAEGATGCVANATYTAALTTGLADKVLSTATVAGVSGNVTLPAEGKVFLGTGYGTNGTDSTGSLTLPSAGNVLAGSGLYGDPGSQVTPTMIDKGTWDLTTGFPGAGYYGAVSNAPVQGDIRATVDILGVTGNVTAPPGDCGSDGDVSCVVDGTNYKAAAVSVLLEGNIKDGITIGGQLGILSAAGGSFADFMASGIHRDKDGTPTQMTIADELASGLSMNALWTTGYREIPLISKDDDGYSGSSVTKVARDAAGDEWDADSSGIPRKVCGIGLSTIALRVTDCDTQHAAKPSWDSSGGDGKLSWDGSGGNASEGSWTLVSVYKRAETNGNTCDSSCREVWRDDRTGLIWSDRLGDLSTTVDAGEFNWCKATGSSNRPSSPYAEDDPNDYCDNVTNQSQTDPLSLCAEDSSWLSTPTGITDAATYEFDIAKAGMRAQADHDDQGAGQSPTLHWRVPSKYDWQLADDNGVRHVLPNMPSYFWSSSASSNNRNNAWRFYGSDGYVNYFNRSSTFAVRCIARP
jgi:hypothetical protein